MIIKTLKNYVWTYDEGDKWLVITDIKTQDRVAIPKTQMFSLFRFLIRVSQRLSSKRRLKKKGGKNCEGRSQAC